MVKKCKAAAAVILAVILTACGQQQESREAGPVQAVEETGGRETGTQTAGEQPDDMRSAGSVDPAGPESGTDAQSTAPESGADAGRAGKENEPDSGETAGAGSEERKPETDSMEADKEPAGETAGAEEETTQEQDAEEAVSILYGSWQVVDYKTCQVYAMSQQEIEELLAYKISYYENGVSLNGQQVRLENFGYTFVDYARTELSQDFNVDLAEWWNERMSVPMGRIVSDEGFFGDTFFPADADHLWIYYNGVFFRAEKTRE